MAGILWRGMQKFKNIEILQGGVHIGVGGVDPPTTDYFVDSTLGASGNSGLGWRSHALATISQAMTKAAALGTRGRVRIFVAPGEYAENVVTPLNTECPFGQLIAWNPTGRESFGAAYIIPASGVALTVRARGWLIQGFEIDGVADSTCVWLDGSTANSSAQGTEIRNCLIVGQNTCQYGIDVTGNGAPHTKVIGCGFYGFAPTTTDGKCITCTSSATDQPRFWIIEDCWFGDSNNLIDMNPRGFKESIIRNNTFFDNGANQNPDEIIDNTGGNDTMVYGNKFLGTYSNTGGYVAGTNDNWAGNSANAVASRAVNGWTIAVPA